MSAEDDSDSKPLLCRRCDASHTGESSDNSNCESEADEGETHVPCYGSFASLPGELNSFQGKETPGKISDSTANPATLLPAGGSKTNDSVGSHDKDDGTRPGDHTSDLTRKGSHNGRLKPKENQALKQWDSDDELDIGEGDGHDGEQHSMLYPHSSSIRVPSQDGEDSSPARSTPSFPGAEMFLPVRSTSFPRNYSRNTSYVSDDTSIDLYSDDSMEGPVRCMSMPEGLVLETEENDNRVRVPRVTITTPSSSSSESWESFSFWQSTREQKLILACLGMIDMSSYLCLSILAPFFPQEAARKGVNGTVSGWIFGVFALVQFLTSPIFGKLLPVIGSRFLFMAGQFFAGGCVILFGVLDFVPTENDGGLMFTILCFVLRVFLALGCTASATASFAITANTFPDHVATVFGILETFAGLGLMVGPALGGVLFEVGGFMTPFVVLGTLTILILPLNMYILPAQEDDYGEQTGSLKELLSVPSILITALAVVVGGMIWAILDPTLEPHLSEFNLSPTVVGLIFLLMSAFYAVFSPIWGWVCDKVEDSSPLLILGFVFSGVGLLLLGPSPIFGLDPNYNELWLNIVSLIILGVAVSLAVVPTFDKFIDAADKAGIEDNFSMYGVVAGLWGSMYALGDFIGPSVGGALVDQMGFPWTMTLTAAVCGVMALLCTILWLYESKFGPSMSCMKRLRDQVAEREEAKKLPPAVVTEPTERTSLLSHEFPDRGRLTERHILRRQRSRSVGVPSKTSMSKRQPALVLKPDRHHSSGVVSDNEVSYSSPATMYRRQKSVRS